MAEYRLPQINQVALAGRLTADPEFHFTESGHPFLTFTLAVNRSYKDRAETWQQETTFVPVCVWGQLAEYCADQLHKGQAVFLTERLESHSWETPDGTRTLLRLLARSVQLLNQPDPPALNGQTEEAPSA